MLPRPSSSRSPEGGRGGDPEGGSFGGRASLRSSSGSRFPEPFRSWLWRPAGPAAPAPPRGRGLPHFIPAQHLAFFQALSPWPGKSKEEGQPAPSCEAAPTALEADGATARAAMPPGRLLTKASALQGTDEPSSSLQTGVREQCRQLPHLQPGRQLCAEVVEKLPQPPSCFSSLNNPRGWAPPESPLQMMKLRLRGGACQGPRAGDSRAGTAGTFLGWLLHILLTLSRAGRCGSTLAVLGETPVNSQGQSQDVGKSRG